MTDVLLDSGSLYAGGMTILHSFWQATLLATVLWAVSRYTNLNAPWRYALGYGLLLTQVLLSVLTCLYYYEPAPTPVVALPADYLIIGSQGPVADGPAQWTNLSFWLPGLVVAWAAGILVGSLRLAWSCGRIRRIAAASLPILPTGEHEHLYRWARHLAERIGYTGRLRLGITDRIHGPLLVGHLRPMLLFPVALVNGLSTEEAETIILHELAHLRRYDHLLNPLQCLLEVVFYYHPAIHWIGARIRDEREHCCDDLVLRYGPGRLAYARALLFFSERAAKPARGALALADGGGLVARVRRLINNQEKKYTMNTRILLLPLLALLTLAASAVYAPADPGTELAGAFPTSPAPATTPEGSLLDTLPQGSHQVTKISNGKTTRLRVEEGEIKEFELEGETIPEADYPNYEERAEELLGVRTPKHRSTTDTVILGYGAISNDAQNALRSLQDGDHHVVIERAMRQLRDLDMDFNFEKLGVQLDSLGDQLEYLRTFSAADGDVMIRISGLDSLQTIHLPDLRRLENLEETNLESLEEQERLLKDALRELEERKRKLSNERSGEGSMGYIGDPPGVELDEQIAARKAAARMLREKHLAEARRVREGVDPTDCPTPIMTMTTQGPVSRRVITVPERKILHADSRVILLTHPG